tara:strand:- start:985 stop:1644 length:660 start_codon:yes stop_codon:yes gene_type:complete
MEPEEQQCAIRALLRARKECGKTDVRNERDSVVRWLRRNAPGGKITKGVQNGHVVNVMHVSPAEVKRLLMQYRGAFLDGPPVQQPSRQPVLPFAPEPSPKAAPDESGKEKTLVEEVRQGFLETRKKIEAMVSNIAKPARPLTVEAVLKAENLTRLNASQVGAKATRIFAAVYVGRHPGKRQEMTADGRAIEVNAWTDAERPILQAAAWAVYASQLPGNV